LKALKKIVEEKIKAQLKVKIKINGRTYLRKQMLFRFKCLQGIRLLY